VTTSIAVDAWQAVGDPTQLLQVLVNLVANARDAMPGGGTLQLTGENLVVTDAFTERVAAPGNYVLIRVEDTGTGMPREVVERVFEPFFTTKGIGEGTGLGLATSVSIVQSHGGAMRVHSEPGSGSRFDILIPAATAAEEPEKTPARPAEAPRGSGQLVLVADDEPDIRRAARLALESYGYRVAVVSNGQEALDYLIQFPGQTQLVFSDMAMPVMDGDALLAAIDDRFADLPVLLTSGLSLWSPAPATRRGFLAKPYSTDQLRAEIARLLTN
jgi:CheY-like chemotaxis protein